MGFFSRNGVVKGEGASCKGSTDMTGCWESVCASQALYFEAPCSLSLQGSRTRARLGFWHIAWELYYSSWVIQTAEIRCWGCPFNPQTPLKTSRERLMCRGWKRGRGNRGQMGVCEHFQPPPRASTWLCAVFSMPSALAPRFWILCCYGDSKYLFLQSLPPFCVSDLAWEGESSHGKGEAACSPLCRSLAEYRCFCAGLAASTSSLVCDVILVCSMTNLFWSMRRVVCLCSDKLYEHNVAFMTIPLDLLITVKAFFPIRSQIMSLSPPFFLKEKQFVYSPVLKEHPQGGGKWHICVFPNMYLLCFKGYLRLSFDILLKVHEFLSLSGGGLD